jgi:hypothetical protein
MADRDTQWAEWLTVADRPYYVSYYLRNSLALQGVFGGLVDKDMGFEFVIMGSIPGWSILFAPVFGKDYIFLIIFRRKLWYLAVIPVFF